jgi:pyrroloquinoline quinone (PQQ) biosynthesis protein C
VPGADTLPESERLRLEVGLVLPPLRDAAHRFSSDPRIAELYPEYLIRSHWVVRASVPLMETARSRAAELDVGSLVDYLIEHIVEEQGHDEWLLEDLEILGIRRDEVLARPPSAAAASLVGAQYYWIGHAHPVALLGYMSVLEGLAPDPSQIERLIERTGLDRRAFRTLFEHAELDSGHAAEIGRVLDRLTLTSDERSLVGISAVHTVTMLARFFDELVGAAETSA